MTDEIETEVIGKFLKQLVEIDEIDHQVAEVLQTALSATQLPKADALAEAVLDAMKEDLK